MKPVLTLVFAVLAASAADAFAAPTPKGPIPVILATDIGDDIDDTWALALLLRSPELDLRLVLTDYGDTVYRARLTAKLLQLAGRSDVPIGIGIRQAQAGGRQAAWLGDYALAAYRGRVFDDGVQALLDMAMAAEEPITLIAIGPAPTLRAALEREPRIAGKLRLAGMYGSLREGYAPGSKPEPEWNVRADAVAARALLGAPWASAVVTPLDTCGRVRLDGPRYARLAASKDPLLQALFESYRLWCPLADWCDKERVAEQSTTLFDTVAVYLAFARDFVKTESLGVEVRDDGMTVPQASARPLTWATEWKDLDAFRDLLVDRLLPEPNASAPTMPRVPAALVAAGHASAAAAGELGRRSACSRPVPSTCSSRCSPTFPPAGR